MPPGSSVKFIGTSLSHLHCLSIHACTPKGVNCMFVAFSAVLLHASMDESHIAAAAGSVAPPRSCRGSYSVVMAWLIGSYSCLSWVSVPLVVHCTTGSSLGSSSWSGTSTGWEFILETPNFQTLRECYAASKCIMYCFSFL